MGLKLPRKKVRDARQDAKVAKIEARAEKKVAIQQAKQESRVENILAGESFGQKLGGTITNLADSAGNSLAARLDTQLNGGEFADAISVPVPPPSPGPLLYLGLAAVGILGFLAYTGKLG